MEKTNSQINIAVIGCGYWGPNLIRNFSQIADVKVQVACDQDGLKLQLVRAAYPAIQVVGDWREVLNNSEIDAVCIATPLSTHFPIAKEALIHGKDVFMEKPMVESSEQAQELIRLAKHYERILMIDHTFVFSGAVQKVKRLIEQGELGDLYYFNSERMNLGLIRSDANVVWDLASHDISIIDYLFPEKPIAVSAVGAGPIFRGAAEMATITIRHQGNFTSFIQVSWLSPVKIRKILIAGSKKMVLCDDVEPDEKVKIYDKGIEIDPRDITPFKPLYRTGDIVIPRLDQAEPLKKGAEHFITCLRTRSKPLTDGENGLRVVALLETIEQSIVSQGREVEISHSYGQ